MAQPGMRMFSLSEIRSVAGMKRCGVSLTDFLWERRQGAAPGKVKLFWHTFYIATDSIGKIFFRLYKNEKMEKQRKLGFFSEIQSVL